MQSLTSKFSYLRHTPKGLLIILICLVGIIMRGPASAVAPLALQLHSQFSVSLASIGLLSGVPVFCYALFSPVASILIKRKGIEFTILLSVSLITVSLIIRYFGGFNTMLGATILFGSSVALANISIPAVIARDFPDKVTLITGILSAAMNVGTVSAFALTVPIAKAVGIQNALVSWSLIAALTLWAALAYIFRSKRGGSRASLKKDVKDFGSTHIPLVSGDTASHSNLANSKTSEQNLESNSSNSKKTMNAITDRSVLKTGFCFMISWVFICQCVGFFGFSAWLPTIFESRGLDSSSAGIASSLFQLFGIFGALSVYGLVKKIGFQKTFFLVAICWISLPLGLLILPKLYVIWLSIAGAAQGANYILMFGKIAEYSKNLKEQRQLSTAAQMSGYFVAGITPSVLAILRVVFNSWDIVVFLILLIMISMLFVGLVVYKDNRIDEK